MEDITLKTLQDRRDVAWHDGDMLAYHAVDLIIGHWLGEVAMYVRQNGVLRHKPVYSYEVA